MKKQAKSMMYVLILLIVTVLSFEVFAQGPGFDEDVEDLPVDGGVTLILATAAAYGAKKISDRRRNNRK